MRELYIEPERPQRHLLNGQFLKGHTPHNKGTKMKYKSRKSKKRSVVNLIKGRGAHHKTGAGMNKKGVVIIKDRKFISAYNSVRNAAKWLNITPSHVSACCLKQPGHKTVRGYQVFYEDDNWISEID